MVKYMQGTPDQSQLIMQIDERKKTKLEFSMLCNVITIMMLKDLKHCITAQSLTFKVHFSIAICVEYIDDSLHQRVLLQLG